VQNQSTVDSIRSNVKGDVESLGENVPAIGCREKMKGNGGQGTLSMENNILA